MSRSLYLLFAIAAYAIFLATFLYLIGFVGNLPGPPRSVDRGPDSALAVALIVDVALIALFGLQHSVMARPRFKASWTRIVPAPLERSVYVLFASAALILLFASWRPIDGVVWRVEHPVGEAVLWGLFACGWLIVLLSTFLINHFELFGLQQVYLNLKRRDAQPPRFRTPFFYKAVRHPLYSGFVIAFWATPVMTWGHMLLALGMTSYMLVAIRYEERDLVGVFGSEYEAYQGRVGMLTPRIRPRA